MLTLELLKQLEDVQSLAESRAYDLMKTEDHYLYKNYVNYGINCNSDNIEVLLVDSWDSQDRDSIIITFDKLILSDEDWNKHILELKNKLETEKQKRKENAEANLKKVKLAQFKELKEELGL